MRDQDDKKKLSPERRDLLEKLVLAYADVLEKELIIKQLGGKITKSIAYELAMISIDIICEEVASLFRKSLCSGQE